MPALKYCNYAIINELEACNTWNIPAYTDDGVLNRDNIRLALKNMIKAGVKDKAVIHSKECSFVMDAKSGEVTEVASLKIPKEEIKGSVGAGDAFCAGCLYGIYNGFSDKQLLEFASSTAACNLFSVNSIDGMKSRYVG